MKFCSISMYIFILELRDVEQFIYSEFTLKFLFLSEVHSRVADILQQRGRCEEILGSLAQVQTQSAEVSHHSVSGLWTPGH